MRAYSSARTPPLPIRKSGHRAQSQTQIAPASEHCSTGRLSQGCRVVNWAVVLAHSGGLCSFKWSLHIGSDILVPFWEHAASIFFEGSFYQGFRLDAATAYAAIVSVTSTGRERKINSPFGRRFAAQEKMVLKPSSRLLLFICVRTHSRQVFSLPNLRQETQSDLRESRLAYFYTMRLQSPPDTPQSNPLKSRCLCRTSPCRAGSFRLAS